jgi:hypothetical protein
MTYQTVKLSSIEKYLANGGDLPEEQAIELRERNERLRLFPHSLMLELAYPELDFAFRWCWLHFGPADGECTQYSSEYRVCTEEKPHRHTGKWTTHWFAKSDYNFGFNEWYFVERADCELFRAFLPEINWGERYLK